MPSDLTAVVASAVAEAKGETESSSEADTTESSESSAETAESAAPAETAEATAPAATSEPGPAPEPDETEREMAEFGVQLKPLIPGKRENAIPQSRVKQMVEKAREKWTKAHQTELQAREAKLAAAEKAHQDLIQMALRDPETNLRQLIEANPAYKDAVQKVMGIAPEAVTSAAPGDPMPQPTGQFPDGSAGYTPEDMTKLMEWNARRAEERAYKRYEADANKRFGPIQREWQAQKAFEAQVPQLRERVAKAEALWGADRMKKHEAEITAKLKASPNPTDHWEQIVAEVMVPKLAAERTSMREEILKELKAAPAAAAKGAPAATAADTPTGSRTLEQVIKDELTSRGMR